MRTKFKSSIFSALLMLLTFSFYSINAAQNTQENGLKIQNKNKPNLLFIMTDQQRFDAMSCAGNAELETPHLDRIAREGVMFTQCYTANPVCVPSRAVLLTGLSSVSVRVEKNGDIENEAVPDVPTYDDILKKNGYAAEYYGKWHTPSKFATCYDNEVYLSNSAKVKAYQAYLETKGVTPKKPGKGELLSSRNQRPYEPIELDADFDKVDLNTVEKMKLKSKQSTQYGRIDLPPRVSFTSFTGEETLDALERLKYGPFTLTCSFNPPHPPMVLQEPYYSLYDPKNISAPETITDPMEYSPYKERANQKGQLPYRNAEQVKNMRSIYYGMVKEIDDWVGEILDKLDELGLAENTLVVFTSDHGEMLGDHGLNSKMIFYEGSVHVPLLMRMPGQIKPGTVVDAPVSTMDVSPTILDYLNMTIPPCDGISLQTLVEGKSVDHDVVSYSTGSSTPNYMIRSGDLKLMIAGNEKNKSVDALYDLMNDPNETRNLILSPISPKKNREQAEMMKARLLKWLEEHEPGKVAGVKNRPLL